MPSRHNRELPALIAEEHPDWLTELAALGAASRSNPSRTLHTMSRHGLVERERGRRGTPAPRVSYSQVRLEPSLAAPSVLRA